MGKTSLVEQVLLDLGRSGVVAATLDLLVVHDAHDLELRLRTAVEQLGARIAPRGRTSSGKLADAFSAFKPEFSVGAVGLKVKLTAPAHPVPGVAEMLLALDRAAGLYRRRVVIVIDEFQQLAQLGSRTAPLGVEGAIRHAVERAEQVTYLFSGSEKHLLASMCHQLPGQIVIADGVPFELQRGVLAVTDELGEFSDSHQLLRVGNRTAW